MSITYSTINGIGENPSLKTEPSERQVLAHKLTQAEW